MPLSSHRTAAKTPRKTPETLRLASIVPSLTVKNPAQSVAWYRDVLGFHVQKEWKEGDDIVGAALQAGSACLVILRDKSSRGADRRKGRHFRIHCTTRQSLYQLAAEIRRRGGIISNEPADDATSTRDFSVIDPDGYELTFSSQV